MRCASCVSPLWVAEPVAAPRALLALLLRAVLSAACRLMHLGAVVLIWMQRVSAVRREAALICLSYVRFAEWYTKKKPSYWQAVQPLKIIHYCSSPKPWFVTQPLLP